MYSVELRQSSGEQRGGQLQRYSPDSVSRSDCGSPSLKHFFFLSPVSFIWFRTRWAFDSSSLLVKMKHLGERGGKMQTRGGG